MATLFRSLIVFVGPNVEPGRPATCFTFDRTRETRPADDRDGTDADDEPEAVRPRRLQ